MAKLSETRDTQDAKKYKEEIKEQAIKHLIKDIRKRLSGTSQKEDIYLDKFDEMIDFICNDDKSYDENFFSEFEILTKFKTYEAKNKIIGTFVEFFKNIVDANSSKNDIVIHYENYLQAITFLEHAFYFYKDGYGKQCIEDKFKYSDGQEITKIYRHFKEIADEYFRPFKEQKDRYDLLNNTQAIKTKFVDTLVLTADMYHVVGFDKNKKASLANKIYKYFYPKSND